MNNRGRFSAVLFVVLLALVPALFAQTTGPFSADINVTPGRDGGEAMNGKFYFGGQRMRIEMTSSGHDSVIITDVPKKVTYIVMPQQQMYMEVAHDSVMMGKKRPTFRPYDAANPCAEEEGVTCKKVGMDMFDGRPAAKWEFMKGAKLYKTIWIDQRTHIPVKTVESDGSITEFKNIKQGAQAASLFELPATYQKMDMGNMMKMPRPPR